MNIVLGKKAKNAIDNLDIFIYNDVKFLNIKYLYDFIKENAKADFVDFEKVVDRVIEDAMSDRSFELRSWETNSGHAEVLDFDYETEIDEETGNVISTIIFK